MPHFLYGKWSVLECLRANRRKMHKLLVTDNADEKGALGEIIQLAGERGVEVHRVPRRVINDLAKEGNHQNVVLRTDDYPYVELDDMLAISQQRNERPFFLALDLLKTRRMLAFCCAWPIR